MGVAKGGSGYSVDKLEVPGWYIQLSGGLLLLLASSPRMKASGEFRKILCRSGRGDARLRQRRWPMCR